MYLKMWAVLHTLWQIFGGVALTEIPGLLRVSFTVICEEKKPETKQTAVVQDCSIFNADIKGETDARLTSARKNIYKKNK